MFRISVIPYKTPAIICHHIYIPFALISCFHSTNVLVKSFTLLFAVRTTFIRKVFKMSVQEMHFHAHPRAKSFVAFNQFLDQKVVMRRSAVSMKLFTNSLETTSFIFLFFMQLDFEFCIFKTAIWWTGVIPLSTLSSQLSNLIVKNV